MPKSRLRGGKTNHRKRVNNRNEVIHQKKIALTNQIIANMNKQNESQK